MPTFTVSLLPVIANLKANGVPPSAKMGLPRTMFLPRLIAVPVTAEQLFLDALSLPPEARADLVDRLVASSAEAMDLEIERAHLAEVRRRIARVDSGKVELIPGEQVLSDGRALLASLMHQP